MLKKRILPSAVAALLALTGCDRSPTDMTDTTEIVVMTRNIYIGAAVEPLLRTDPEQLPFVVAAGWAMVAQTDFEERAAALADEIEAARPHLIGLQEVSLWRLQSPGDYMAGNPTPATSVVADYLEILLTALKQRGLEYRAVVIATNADIELPVYRETASGPAFDDLRLTDRDVILARKGVRTFDPRTGHYTARLEVGPLSVVRSWGAVGVEIEGRKFVFANTHLESSDIAPIQVAQGIELVEHLLLESLPVILVGDLNTAADGHSTATHALMRTAGYNDTWPVANGSVGGFTCCQSENLRNPASELVQRIDYILLGKGFDAINPAILASARASLVGDKAANRTPSGLWPSDHAGVVTSIELPRFK